jgi:DNA-binding MarR family transcriptional regulator
MVKLLDQQGGLIQDDAMAGRALARLLLEAFRSVDGEMLEALRDRGLGELTPAQAEAMFHIDRGGTRLTELSQRAEVTKQAMMQVVDHLESAGLVRRRPDPSDARAKVVKLTAKGLRQRAEARRAAGSVEGRIRRRLGDRRFELLRATLVDVMAGEE